MHTILSKRKRDTMVLCKRKRYFVQKKESGHENYCDQYGDKKKVKSAVGV